MLYQQWIEHFPHSPHTTHRDIVFSHIRRIVWQQQFVRLTPLTPWRWNRAKITGGALAGKARASRFAMAHTRPRALLHPSNIPPCKAIRCIFAAARAVAPSRCATAAIRSLCSCLPQLARGLSVGAVAQASGYASESAFASMFKAAMGHSPKQFLRVK
jgi:hypothetical protein